MAYRGNRSGAAFSNQSRGAGQSTGGSARGKIETVRAYNVAFRVDDGEYISVGIVEKYADSGNLTMSLNKEALDKLPVTESGWINKIRLYTPKDK